MCSHYLVTVLCWAYSNCDMFSSCKTKTPLPAQQHVCWALEQLYFLGLVKPSPPSGHSDREVSPVSFISYG